MRPVFRADPLLPAAAMKTYEISAPIETHYRRAPCSEVDCTASREGWRTLVDVGTKLGQAQARYLRDKAGRAFVIERDPIRPGALTFIFPAGQQCFEPHLVPLERPAIYVVREGDWRGNPRELAARTHRRAADWVDDFANHQDQLATAINRG